MRDLVSHASRDYLTFAIVSVIFLILALAYFYLNEKRKENLSFPCVEPTDEVLGNLNNVKEAGGLHNYLTSLHRKHGPIVGFWWNKELAVSLGSTEAYKDILGLFDRPVKQFLLLKPLIGSHSIQYANGVEGRKMRKLLDKFFSHEMVKGYVDIFNEVGSELVRKWQQCSPEEHLPLRQFMLALAFKSIVKSSFGDTLNTDKEILKFEEAYDTCFGYLQKQFEGDGLEPGSDREKRYLQALNYLKSVTANVVKERKQLKNRSTKILLDVMIDESEYFSTLDMIHDNAISYLVGGFHTTGNLLTWIIYYIAKDMAIQDRLYKEIIEIVGKDDVNVDHVSKLEYVRMVINETLRVAVLAPWGARVSEHDMVICGHVIRKNTPLIIPFGVVLHDPEIWPEPEKFDPERFSAENMKKVPSLAFSPFGFAGKRKCPGYRFSNAEATVLMAILIRKFKFYLVPDQDVQPDRQFVTQPKEEIWITIESRKEGQIIEDS